jgi:hypothetical protein
MKQYQFMTIDPRSNSLDNSSDKIIGENLLNEYLRAFDKDKVNSFDDWLITRYEGLVYLWRPVKNNS